MKKVININPQVNNNELWTICSDGFFNSIVVNAMKKDDYPEDSIKAITQNAVEILSQCPNPNTDTVDARTGIIIGKVQSGKTSNFISLIGLAFDNGYNLAIVLGGNKIPLLAQNVERIKKSFKVDPMKLVVIDTDKNKGIIDGVEISDFIKQGRKVIIVGLKHPKHINLISKCFQNSYLTNVPTLIIDDEGDQATLNTKYNKKQLSTTYSSALTLKSNIKKHCFISVTATPQANILIDTWDILSPDFGVLVYPGEGYCGLLEFHSNEDDPYIREIPNDEVHLLSGKHVPQTVYDALSSFFVSNAIRKYRGDFGNHAILFHPSEKKVDHSIVLNKINPIILNWKDIAKNPEDIAYQKLRRYLISAYEKYKKEEVKLPRFEDLEDYVLDSIKMCSNVHLCNSDTEASNNSELYKTNIFVGGNMLERGLTIKGLAITYIIRRAKGKSNIDNMEQRARWFGYKKDYLDICRVYTTDQIKKDFKNIYEHEESLWDNIEGAINKGITFKEIPRVFVNKNKLLRLTRTNVAKTQSLLFDKFTHQNSVILDKQSAINNTFIIEKIKKDNIDNLILKQYSQSQKHLFLTNMNFSYVKKELFDKYKFPKEENLNNNFFALLEQGLIHLNLSPLVDVVWMRYDVKQTRKMDENGKISTGLMQGPNPNSNSPDYYIGDRKIIDENPDNIQIQIHMVKPNNLDYIDYYSPFFSIYIPIEISNKLAQLVTRKE